MKKIIGAVGAWFFGNATWIAALVNFIWLLVKDEKLFSWMWVVSSAVLCVVSIGIMLWGVIEQ